MTISKSGASATSVHVALLDAIVDQQDERGAFTRVRKTFEIGVAIDS